MTHSPICNTIIPDDYLIPYGGIKAAAILKCTKDSPETVHVFMDIGDPSKDSWEFGPSMVGACFGHHFIIEYTDAVEKEAEDLTRTLYTIEGVYV